MQSEPWKLYDGVQIEQFPWTNMIWPIGTDKPVLPCPSDLLIDRLKTSLSEKEDKDIIKQRIITQISTNRCLHHLFARIEYYKSEPNWLYEVIPSSILLREWIAICNCYREITDILSCKKNNIKKLLNKEISFFNIPNKLWRDNVMQIRNIFFHGSGIVQINVDKQTDFDVEIVLTGVDGNNEIRESVTIGYLELFNLYQKLNYFYYWLLHVLVI